MGGTIYGLYIIKVNKNRVYDGLNIMRVSIMNYLGGSISWVIINYNGELSWKGSICVIYYNYIFIL